MREQEKWAEHASFMDKLAEEGFLVLAGPLGGGGPHHTLLIFDADSEEAIHARLEADPRTPMDMLNTTSIERWEILIGRTGTV